MEKLPPIPTPLATRWREFRFQFIPVLTMCAVVAGVAAMWRQYVVPPNVLAEVEPITANVVSTQPGLVVSLNVDLFQRVTNGQEICQVQIMETNVLTAGLGVITSDLEVRRGQIALLQLRDSMIYEREYLVYLQEGVAHNINKKLLTRYEADFIRTSNLWVNISRVTNNNIITLVTNKPLVSEAQYDAALSQYEKYKVDVEETEIFLKKKEATLPKLKVDNSNLIYCVEQDIKAQAERLVNTSSNLVLRAPIAGTVSLISHRAGERVLAGNPIVVITPLRSERIIAYMRQPINVAPRIGDVVQVRRQNFRREYGYGKVLQVGSQMALVDPTLFVGTTKFKDMALPFLVSAPRNLALSPGERVDVIFNPRRKFMEN